MYETLKEGLNLIYLLSTPAVAIFAFLALRQISIAKEQLLQAKSELKTNSMRDALKLTGEQVRHFNDIVIPILNEFDDINNKYNVKCFKQAKLKLTKDGLKVSKFERDEGFIKHRSEILEIACKASNSFEAFAIFFTSGVASEKAAFNSVGSTYCGYVSQLIPLILAVSQNNGEYNATLNLYHLWQSRIEEDKLLKERDKIEQNLSNLSNEKIYPIGV